MLIFAAPIALTAVAAVAALGIAALWRGRRMVRKVSHISLWRDSFAESPQRRRLDPLWLLVFVAALLAAAALASPAWIGPGNPDMPRAEVTCAARSLRSSPATNERVDVYITISHENHLPETLTLGINGKDYSVPLASRRGGYRETLPRPAAGEAVKVSLRADNTILYEQTFTRPALADGQPFALLKQVGPQSSIDPALERIFRVQPNVRRDDPLVRPAVLLVNDPAFQLSPTTGPLLVIAQPATPLPGITLGPWRGAPADSPGFTPRIALTGPKPLFSWPNWAHLDSTRIRRLREAVLSLEWQVLATVDSLPWIAIRARPSENTNPRTILVWLASDPAVDTNWPQDPRFVALFAEMATTLVSGGEETAPRSRIIEWQPANPPTVLESTTQPPIHFQIPLAITSACLFLAAAGWFLLRNRR